MAIEYLHSKDIVYRDIKPENIMLDLDGHARLIDFGLSKLNVTDDISTFTKTLCGTNCYMAPEVVREKGEKMFFVKSYFLFLQIQNFREIAEFYGRSADWWSFGVLAYDMLTGGPPFKAQEKKEVRNYFFREIVALYFQN